MARYGNRRIPADLFSETVGKYGLCPNRLWAAVGENLSELLPDGALPGHKDHETCTFGFCEWSQKDFTAVGQRHECADQDECQSLLFPKTFLDDAVFCGRSTAWKLDGSALIDWPEMYMAVSHVWSDGTGAGAWPDGEVNECLYNFFRDVARQFSCKGIWWDTICIPRGKVARKVAINKMHENYQDARITLVHDCFLRSWDWVDAETACFAILLSPWFGRGWTALELAMSRKVKVVFNGPRDHPIIKDLDEEILAKETGEGAGLGPPTRHQRISRIIRNLRAGITSLDDLVGLLGARYTSWPADMLTIARLLVGVELETGDNKPHELQRNILKKLGKVSPGNLFHSFSTISNGTSWCSTRLLDMPRSKATPSLHVENEVSLRGQWQPVLLDNILEASSFIWNQTHPLVRRKLEEHLQEGDFTLLAEVDPNNNSAADTEEVGRALLVRQAYPSGSYEYVGALYFHPPCLRDSIADGQAQEFIILGGSDDQVEEDTGQGLDRSSETPTNDDAIPTQVAKEPPGPTSHGWTPLHFAVWRCQTQLAQQIITEGQVDISARDRLGGQALHLAAERGNLELVQSLHFAQTSPSYEESGVLESAVWGGSVDVVNFLLTQNYKPSNMGMSALGLVSKLGFASLLHLFPDAVSSLNDANLSASPLHIAANNHHANVVAYLVQDLTDLDKRDKFGWTALHVAASSGCLPIVELLANDNNIELVNNEQRTALQQALLNDRRAIIRFLIGRGANLNVMDSSLGWSPLHITAYHGDLEATKQLIEGSEEMANIADRRVGWTPLHLAAMQGHVEIAKLLIQSQPNHHQKDYRGWTPGMFATFKGHSKMVEILGGQSLCHPGDVTNLGRWTDLHFAAVDGQPILKLMQQSSASKEVKPRQSQVPEGDRLPEFPEMARTAHNGVHTVLGYAAMKNHPNLIKLLLKWNEDVNSETQDGATCLHYAASHKSTGLARYLIDHKAKIAAKDPHGQTPLHWAANAGARGVVDLLIKRGSDPNSPAMKYNFRPIHYAVTKNHLGVIDLLLNVGADMMATCRSGDTALALAVRQGNISAVSMMLDRGTDFHSMQVEGTSMLQLAAECGQPDLVDLFIRKGANVRDCDMSGFTALHYAAWKGRNNVVTLLLDNGADIEAVDARGYTPLHVAREHLHDATISLLCDRGAVDGSPQLPPETILRSAAMREVLNSSAFDHPLHMAIKEGDAEQVKAMIKGRENTDILNNPDLRPLHMAVKYGHINVAEVLINKDPEMLHSVYDTRVTPLGYAAFEGSEKMVQYLLEKSKKVNGSVLKVFRSKTLDQDLTHALKHALMGGHKNIVDFLLSCGADFRSIDKNRLPFWYYAIYSGSVATVESLIQHGFGVNEVDNEGRTALHYAVWHGNIAISRLLIQRMTSFDAIDNLGKSFVVYAGEYSNKPMLYYLIENGIKKTLFLAEQNFQKRAGAYMDLNQY